MTNEPYRKHFFRDEQDNRTVVVTCMLPNGQYAAFIDENDDCDDHRYGEGHTRLAAIADLQEQIEDQQNDGEG